MPTIDVVVEGTFEPDDPLPRREVSGAASSAEGRSSPPLDPSASGASPQAPRRRGGFGTREVAGPARKSVVEHVADAAGRLEPALRTAAEVAGSLGATEAGERLELAADVATSVETGARAVKAAADDARELVERARPTLARLRSAWGRVVGKLKEKKLVGRAAPRVGKRRQGRRVA